MKKLFLLLMLTVSMCAPQHVPAEDSQLEKKKDKDYES